MAHSLKATDFISGAFVGLVLWIGFAITHSLNTQFEGRKPKVPLINNISNHKSIGLASVVDDFQEFLKGDL